MDIMPYLLFSSCTRNHFRLCTHICCVQSPFLLVLRFVKSFFFVLSSSPFFSDTWQDLAEVGHKMVNKYVKNYRKKSLVLIQSEFSDDSNCDGDSSCE